MWKCFIGWCNGPKSMGSTPVKFYNSDPSKYFLPFFIKIVMEMIWIQFNSWKQFLQHYISFNLKINTFCELSFKALVVLVNLHVLEEGEMELLCVNCHSSLFRFCSSSLNHLIFFGKVIYFDKIIALWIFKIEICHFIFRISIEEITMYI